ncbi:GNAT family N-acetyltransferase [Agrobacterium vitis]|uniref:GNAT family N-acetyltransferase n=1 Tax=Agrobacterium vitis TaxID=373 RepID=A0ABD6GK14_AGRVI|nr:GNAT family N-acetyltransferase [Agrobacterium vitis]MUO81589.1 GNAT family N-acetyltransferase [Agrobacterium vitis]MUO95267.1 GNAT family N-acetyltransferase [Agrobacterium vitis]MUP07297.1 GNAT family N-acetyltransferase [Agrobacterium vitis]MUZ83721.1 GNAT family N-acetyltransferase [Agrobacterium vitis]MVA09320.1 GNAT family N-acetyltransferase [Agrobacterium vitis]
MDFSIRKARPEDVPVILRFITDLAIFEKAEHEVKATVESLHESLFGEGAVAFAAILEQQATPVGHAIWFYNYSTWQARKGLYLEDLYIDPAHRGGGAGRAMLRYLAKLAVDTGCGRFEWSVLDWNEPAIRVYDSVGAEPQTEWIRYRLSGDKLAEFAAGR